MGDRDLPVDEVAQRTVAEWLDQTRLDLETLVWALNNGNRQGSALEAQQLVVAICKFSDHYSDNFERAVYPPRAEADGDGLVWREE